MLTSVMPLGLAVFIECVMVGVCLLLMYAVIAVVMIFMERKVPGDTKKVLCLGNSFSYYSNPAWMLKEIACFRG